MKKQNTPKSFGGALLKAKSVCLTPTWTALVPALLDAYANAEPLRRETIREEFLLMAEAADVGVDLVERSGTLYYTGAPGPAASCLAARPD